ncbi:MAG: T9SS type A sorting domain-containing protein [Candidatus Brocadiales bacterium]|nr:T9SS type A sorting domain-containing protein [Candidatus Brocadiales bacterium]
MKKHILTALLYAVLIVGNTSLRAQYYSGAYISYKNLGGYDYIVTLTFFRNCQGVNEPSSCNVNFVCSSNSQYNFSATLQKKPGVNGLDVTNNCSSVTTKCNAGTFHGIQEWVYEGLVNLPPCNNWKISFSGGGCRNSNTITSSSSGYIETTLNNVSVIANSTPILKNKPIIMICNGQGFSYNYGAVDSDRDSLSYEWIAPRSSPTSSVNYVSGYSYTQFLASNPPISLNPVTGDFIITPTLVQVTYYDLKIKEWRKINGNMVNIAYTVLDIDICVDYCNNIFPKLSGMDTMLTHTYDPSDNLYNIEVCYGETVSFDINAYDADSFSSSATGSPEKMSMSWNNGIPDASFSVYNQNTDSVYANFSWTSYYSNVSNLPYCFTANLKDLACPYNGIQSRAYCIKVSGLKVDIGSDTSLCNGEILNIVADADESTVNYIWKVNGIPTATPFYDSVFTFNSAYYPSGIYTVEVETNNGDTSMLCPGKDQIHITVKKIDTSTTLNLSTITSTEAGASYQWLNCNNSMAAIPGETGQSFTALADGSYAVEITKNSCTDTSACVTIINAGMIQNSFKESFKVYPNPTHDYIFTEFTSVQDELTVKLMSVTGEMIINKTIRNSNIAEIKTDIPAGIYLLEITDEEGHKAILKIIKE